jgi:hypothetical protein
MAKVRKVKVLPESGDDALRTLPFVLEQILRRNLSERDRLIEMVIAPRFRRCSKTGREALLLLSLTEGRIIEAVSALEVVPAN